MAKLSEKAARDIRLEAERVLSTFGNECCESRSFSIYEVKAYAEDICASVEKIINDDRP